MKKKKASKARKPKVRKQKKSLKKVAEKAKKNKKNVSQKVGSQKVGSQEKVLLLSNQCAVEKKQETKLLGEECSVEKQPIQPEKLLEEPASNLNLLEESKPEKQCDETEKNRTEREESENSKNFLNNSFEKNSNEQETTEDEGQTKQLDPPENLPIEQTSSNLEVGQEGINTLNNAGRNFGYVNEKKSEYIDSSQGELLKKSNFFESSSLTDQNALKRQSGCSFKKFLFWKFTPRVAFIFGLFCGFSIAILIFLSFLNIIFGEMSRIYLAFEKILSQ